jgi:hypothetical protein
MMKTPAAFALLAFGLAAPLPAAHAAKLPELDKAWTDHCVNLRKASKNLPSVVRNYCACMQEIVGAGDRFDSSAAMERKYPSAHRGCMRKAGMRPG